jgi:hypothetical protein
VTAPDKNAEETLRRDLTRQINTLYRAKYAKESWLKDTKTADQASLLIASAEVAGLDSQIGILQHTLCELDRRPAAEPPTTDGRGSVQGTGAFAADSEMGTARLVKVLRAALPMFSTAALPWVWGPTKKLGVLDRLCIMSQGRYVIIAESYGVPASPQMMAYLARAGAMFPALLLEVIALRIALAEKGGTPAYGEAEALLGVRKPMGHPGIVALDSRDWTKPAGWDEDAKAKLALVAEVAQQLEAMQAEGTKNVIIASLVEKLRTILESPPQGGSAEKNALD